MADYNQNTQAYQDLWKTIQQQQDSLGSNDRVGLRNRLNSLTDSFTSQFTNLVGRGPSQAELDQFYSSSAPGIFQNANLGRTETDPANVNSELQSFIGNNFRQAAQDTATQQLTAQQGQANDLANLFRTQGRQAISDTESQLMDYQSQLFERLRPNLITSLQAQGLLNTGGLNEAMAGAQKDLAASSQGFLASASLNNENAANQIAFGGASAPYQYQQASYLNQVPYLQGQAQTATNNDYNTFLTNLNTRNQMALQNNEMLADQSLQPSTFRTFSQGFASNPFVGSTQSAGGIKGMFSKGAVAEA